MEFNEGKVDAALGIDEMVSILPASRHCRVLEETRALGNSSKFHGKVSCPLDLAHLAHQRGTVVVLCTNVVVVMLGFCCWCPLE